VNATDPSTSPQDVRLNVRILGSNFNNGSTVRFLLNGKSVATVVVNATTFVNTNELVADVSIALEATPDLYDVEVTAFGGKKGIGIEKFAVTGPTADLAPELSSSATGVFGDGAGLYPGEFVTASGGNFNVRPWCADDRSITTRLAWSITGTPPDCDGSSTHVQFHVPGLFSATADCAGGCPIGGPPVAGNFGPSVFHFFTIDVNGDGRINYSRGDKGYDVVWTDARYWVLRRATDGTPCSWRVTGTVADLYQIPGPVVMGTNGAMALDVTIARDDGVCGL
jgi:hypothetical protein